MRKKSQHAINLLHLKVSRLRSVCAARRMLTIVFFSGRGSALVPDEYGEGSSAAQPSGRTTPPDQATIVLKMWSNGFSLDDGPLRSFSDPENEEFLSSIKRGAIPRELVRAARGKQVSLNMEDHHTEEYVAPKRTIVAFSGAGHRLGAVTPETITSPSLDAGTVEENEKLAAEKLKVNESSPTTCIQVRLADGTRFVVYTMLSFLPEISLDCRSSQRISGSDFFV